VASFRQTPYGWRAEVYRNGIRRSASAFRTKAAARAWAARQEAEIMAGVRGEIPDITVKALLERYRTEVSASKKGARWEAVRLMAWERDRLAQVRLRQLDAPHVSDWQQRRLKAVSSASVRRERNLLNNVFEIARKEWRWLGKNPFEGVRRPKDGRPRTRIASQEEIDKLLAQASPAMARAITFALETGMRAGEIAALREVRGSVAFLLDTKNGEARAVPLSSRAIEVWQDGIPLSAGSISGLFARLCEDAGIEGLTFHDLRATAITRLAQKLDVLQLAKMIGHKNPKMLMVYYRESAEDIARKLG
jgi:integrase